MALKIALTGNPNSGKTSIFNKITGAMQKVGNWGGVTVEIKEGLRVIDGEKVTFVDLPGTYSLNAFSIEERVARDYIVEQTPDVIIDVIDATNLDRHLYLTIQLMELGIRPVLALNMWDEVLLKGIEINIQQFEALLGCPVIATSARTGEGIDSLIKTAVSYSKNRSLPTEKLRMSLPVELEIRLDKLTSLLTGSVSMRYPPRWIAIKLFEHDPAIEKLVHQYPNVAEIVLLRDRFEKEIIAILGDEPGILITENRYGYIAGLLREVIAPTRKNVVEVSDAIDEVLTHRFWAYPVFLGFMWLLFQATFKLGEYPLRFMKSGIEWLTMLTQNTLPAGIIKDLVIEGILAGVGGVIVFIPNIMILFMGISIMEDTGYMARAAFIMDRLMHKIGLHGKSFIPMLMGMGCTVPAIMAARTLEAPSDRIKTILLTPLISCSARLPIYVLFASIFFKEHAGNVVFLFQVVLGFLAFIGMAVLFKHTLFRNAEDVPFVMELPPYRIPTFRSILIHMWQKAEHYLKKMGGVVLIFSIIIWWAGTYPKSSEIETEYTVRIENVQNDRNITTKEKTNRISVIRAQMHSQAMKQTYIGRIGKTLEPAVELFGTDWRGAVSLVTGFVAKELVVGSMGVLYAAESGAEDKNEELSANLRDHFTPLSAFAFMLFVLLYTPCVVAFITVIRELNNWKWAVFSATYQLLFAWIAATTVFQAGRLMGL